jgi:quercetin dioxygenase-like cupin family protein
MKRNRLECLLAATALGVSAAPLIGSSAEDEEGFIRIAPEEIVWDDRPTGPDFAVIAGDPQKEGFYVVRARFAPGVMSQPHYHPSDRHVTVISGTWHTGTGAKFDPNATVALQPGSYMLHPAGAVHFDGAKDEEVIVEIKGIGPAPTIPVGQ